MRLPLPSAALVLPALLLPTLLLPALLLGGAAPAPAAVPATRTAPAGTAIDLSARPGTPLDTTARQLVADELRESSRAGEQPLLLTGAAPLGTASDRPAVFVQLQSARECGSAGCATTAFLWRNGAWKKILDGVGGKLTILKTRTRGMADLATESGRYVWTGQEYRDPRPVPAVDLRPRHR